jgi:GAF domain-containing protein
VTQSIDESSEGDDMSVEHPAEDVPESAKAQYALVAPVTRADVPIGNLQLHNIDPHRKWTEGELSLINAVLDQVVQAAENLRLFEQTQERAARERMIGEIGDRMRRAPDMETLMETTMTELARVLGPARAFVQLGSREQLSKNIPTSSDDNDRPREEEVTK